MAELVDAGDLKSPGSDTVPVRFRLAAPKKPRIRKDTGLFVNLLKHYAWFAIGMMTKGERFEQLFPRAVQRFVCVFILRFAR